MTESSVTSSARRLNFFDAAGVGAQSLRRNPSLSAGFITCVLIQGVLQGLLIWAIRNVLIAMSAGEDAATLRVRIGGALLIFVVWVLRAASAYAADSLAMRLATRSIS